MVRKLFTVRIMWKPTGRNGGYEKFWVGRFLQPPCTELVRGVITREIERASKEFPLSCFREEQTDRHELLTLFPLLEMPAVTHLIPTLDGEKKVEEVKELTIGGTTLACVVIQVTPLYDLE